MSKWWTALFVIITLIFSNFLYQSIRDGNWEVALERSYFQAGAILIFTFIID